MKFDTIDCENERFIFFAVFFMHDSKKVRKKRVCSNTFTAMWQSVPGQIQEMAVLHHCVTALKQSAFFLTDQKGRGPLVSRPYLYYNVIYL